MMRHRLITAEDAGDAIRAILFASERHGDQKRKYTGHPYIWHPMNIAELVMVNTRFTSKMLIAALLHDTVEDTETTLTEIENLFGTEVAELVEQLTDVSRPEQGSRAVRKAIDREHTAKASPDAKTIKLADLIDNTASIVEHDPKFAEIYLAEKALLLEVLMDGDPTLWWMALGILVRENV